MFIGRLTPFQVLLGLGISAVLIAGVALTIFVLDWREQAAIRPEDVFSAVGQGDMTRVIECLKAQPKLANARDGQGRTPLHLAAERNLADTTRLLLKLGADPTLQDAEGKTAAEVADAKGARAAAGVLREAAGGR
ncbi:MAG: ankyrin repeat domain-containing protein [Planctomycetes bacterium]|nr:ankyrin repeat domain-containing protein [Planctomycetota bacterium]